LLCLGQIFELMACKQNRGCNIRTIFLDISK
jgi:hypothetical protein